MICLRSKLRNKTWICFSPNRTNRNSTNARKLTTIRCKKVEDQPKGGKLFRAALAAKQTPTGGLGEDAEASSRTGLGCAQQAKKRQKRESGFCPFWATCVQVALLAISTYGDYDGLQFSRFVHGERFVISAARVDFLLRGYVPCRVYFISGGGDVQHKLLHAPSL